jgi:hypothetical protein
MLNQVQHDGMDRRVRHPEFISGSHETEGATMFEVPKKQIP